MISHWVLYDATGRITTRMSGTAETVAINAQRDGLSFLEAFVPTLGTHYVAGGAAVPRPANPARLTGTTLSALPVPSTVTINGAAYVVDDGELEITFPNAGTYAITVSSPFPFLDASFTITT